MRRSSFFLLLTIFVVTAGIAASISLRFNTTAFHSFEQSFILPTQSLAGTQYSSNSLSNADASRIILGSVSKTVDFISTGRLLVVQDTGICHNDYPHRQITTTEFEEITGWANAGLVTIIEHRANSVGDTSNLGFNGLCAMFATEVVDVTATPDGVRLSNETSIGRPKDPRFLYARFSTAGMESVVENKELKKNVDTFRIVKGIIEFHFTEFGKRVFPKRHETMKFVALLKWDAFKNTWDWIATDIAPIDQDIQSQNVESYLAAH